MDDVFTGLRLLKTTAVPLLVALLNAAAVGQAFAQAGNNAVSPAPVGKQPDGSIAGYVDFEVTITEDGKVDNPKVTAEEPTGYGFADSAMKAFPRWRFQPAVADGKPVATKAFYRFTFKVQPDKQKK